MRNPRHYLRQGLLAAGASLALLCGIGTLMVAAGETAPLGSFASQPHGLQHGRCFPADVWDTRQAIRPCAKISRVEEDGSVKVAVLDHDGTVRYTFWQGALDR